MRYAFAVIAIVLVNLLYAPSPYIMGNSNPNHKFVGPVVCPMIATGAGQPGRTAR